MSKPVKFMKPAKWVKLNKGQLPDHPVEGGKDGKDVLFVGCAHHEGAVIPGKIHPAHGVCYIPWGGKEHAKQDYEALSNPKGCQLTWVFAANGDVPNGALQGGYTENGEPLYIGRAAHDHARIIGKVQPSHKVCYIPHAGGEHGKPEYEVLVAKAICFKPRK